MLVYVDNCKVMHVGFNNNNIGLKAKYEMNGKFLREVSEERDLEVVIRNVLKYISVSRMYILPIIIIYFALNSAIIKHKQSCSAN